MSDKSRKPAKDGRRAFTCRITPTFGDNLRELMSRVQIRTERKWTQAVLIESLILQALERERTLENASAE